MNTCPNCQTKNPRDYQFCQYCGNKILAIAIEEVTIEKDQKFAPTLNKIEAKIQEEQFRLKNPLEENLSEIDLSVSTFTDPMELSATIIPTHDFNQNFKIADLEINDFENDFELDELETSQPTITDIDQMIAELPTVIGEKSTNFQPVVIAPEVYLKDIVYAGKTDVGKQRDRNEDDFVAIFQTRNIYGKSQISDHSDRGLFVLCDGMGGHEGGEVASAIAVNSITEQFRPFWIDTLPGERTLNEIICNANQAIFVKNESQQRLSLGRMGTTMVMLAVHDLDVMIAHIGDSRIYKATNNPNSSNSLNSAVANPEYISETAKLEQITRDHEVLNQLIDLGIDREVALARSDAHQLTQAMGPNPSDILEPAIQSFSLTENTLFLLCSDGLCDNDAIEQHWQTHLLPILNKEIDIQTGLENLIDLGNNINGHDNITAILVLCDVLVKS